MGKFFDWLSNLRPRQLLALAGGTAILMFLLMYGAFTLLAKSAIISEDPDQTETGEEKKDEPEVKMKTVVVAAATIEPRTMLISRVLETKEFPENTLPGNAVTDIAEIANKPARVRIFKGDVITYDKVYRNAQQAGFVGTIPPDCRAVSISVNDVTGVAGFAKPGDYVDLILVEKDENLVTSRLLLQDVLLLSINQNMGVKNNTEDNENESSVNPETTAIENPALATVALRPDEILQLVSASKLGEIYLMLRPLVPQSNYYTGAEYSMQTLKGQQKQAEATIKQEESKVAEPEQKQPVEIVEPKPPRIKIYYGDAEELKDTNEDKDDDNNEKNKE